MPVHELLVRDNIASLKQGVGLIDLCGVEHYTRKIPQCFNGSIGVHVRHVIDYYQCFFDAMGNGEKAGIDYDARQRDVRIETGPEDAVHRIDEICAMLVRLDTGHDGAVAVKMDTGSNAPDFWTSSTLQRELQFLLSHTVHHYALIAVIGSMIGLQIPEDFGLAPSTRHYREQSAD